MSDKKNIDRIFQEGFKDFEVQPDDAVWKRIKSKLEKKKQRRVLPIWWPYAGVAAVLALLLGLGYSYFNDTEVIPERDRIVNENPNISPTDGPGEQDQNNPLIPEPKNDQLPENTITKEQQVASEGSSKSKPSLISNDNTLKETKTSEKVNQTKSPSPSTVIAENKSSKPYSNSSKRAPNNQPYVDPVAENNSDKTSIEQDASPSALAKNEPHDTVKTKQDSVSAIVQNTTKKEQSIETVLNNNKILEKEDDDDLSRWSVAANAAPVYFNAIGQGSAIDPQFNGNSKTGDLNMSYGISARYALSKKLRVRSGVNKVSLGYSTNDVMVFQSLGSNFASGTLDFVSKPGDPNISILGANNNTALASASSLISAKPESLNSNASIDQTFGYIEIPLELEYALLNKRFGFRVIGGFSTLFLSNNAVYSQSETGRTYLGEANNMNSTSYSGNFGLGFNYGITKTLDLNIEPLLKYQFNSFNRTAGDFQPFFIGVYTGLSIKF